LHLDLETVFSILLISSFLVVLICLEDGDPDVRVAAVRALPSLVKKGDQRVLTKVESLKGNPGDKITLSQRQLNPDLKEIKA